MDLESWMIQMPRQFYGHVFENAQEAKLPPLHWANKSTMNDDEIDKIINAYIEFLRISLLFQKKKHMQSYYDVCRRFFCETQHKEVQSPEATAAENAFHQDAHGNRDIANEVMSQVSAHFKEFNSQEYIAP